MNTTMIQYIVTYRLVNIQIYDYIKRWIHNIKYEYVISYNIRNTIVNKVRTYTKATI